MGDKKTMKQEDIRDGIIRNKLLLVLDENIGK